MTKTQAKTLHEEWQTECPQPEDASFREWLEAKGYKETEIKKIIRFVRKAK